MINKENIFYEIDLFFQNYFENKKIVTGDIRKISSLSFKEIEEKELNNILELSEILLEKRKWKYEVIAYDWAFRIKSQYNKDTFYIFEEWLQKYVDDWGNCDDFCTHAFGELIAQHNDLFKKVLEWVDHKDFWVRRAAAVILIYPIRKNRLGDISPYIISDKLMNDDHYLVLKGYGWMLKELSKYKNKEVYDYIRKNKAKMPRLSLRYAIEHFEKDVKKELMKK